MYIYHSDKPCNASHLVNIQKTRNLTSCLIKTENIAGPKVFPDLSPQTTAHTHTHT